MKTKKLAPYDWAELEARLARANAATRATLEPSPGDKAAVLEARARALAKPISVELGAERSEVLRLVAFVIGEERYAIGFEYVREVTRLAELLPVPGARPELVGATLWRGEVLPVFDLAMLVGRPKHGLFDQSRHLVLGRDKAELSILADAEEGLTEVEQRSLSPVPARGAPSPVTAMTADGLRVLDGALLLDDPRTFAWEMGRRSGEARWNR